MYAVPDLSEAIEDPQIQHNDIITSIGHPPIGELQPAGIPIRLSETATTVDRYPRKEGGHTHKIRDIADDSTGSEHSTTILLCRSGDPM